MSFPNGVAPQFQSEYNVKVPNAAKNGEVVEFFIETLKVFDVNSNYKSIFNLFQFFYFEYSRINFSYLLRSFK